MVDVTDYGVVNDGVTDNRVALQALINSPPDGTLFFPTGDYIVSPQPGIGNPNRHSLRLENVTDLSFTGDGDARLIFAGTITGTANKSMIGVVSGCSGIRFQGLTFIQGDLESTTGTLDEHTHMIELLPSTAPADDVLFYNCRWGTVKGDCIRMLGTSSGPVRNVRVIRCVMDGFRYAGANPGYGYRAGVSVQRGVHRLLVQDCYLTGATDSVFDCEPSGDGTMSRFTVHHNTFDHRIPGGGSVATAVSFGGNGGDNPLEDSMFCDNLVLNGRVAVASVVRLDFSRNLIIDGPYAAVGTVLDFDGRCEDVSVYDNDVHGVVGSGASAMINVNARSTNYPANIDMRRNEVEWSSGYGIRVQSCPGIGLYNNTLRYAGASVNPFGGIVVQGTTRAVAGCTVHGNKITGALFYGCRLIPSDGMSDVQVTDNVIDGSTTGLALQTGAWSTPAVVNNSFVNCGTPTAFGTSVLSVFPDYRTVPGRQPSLHTGPGAPGCH